MRGGRDPPGADRRGDPHPGRAPGRRPRPAGILGRRDRRDGTDPPGDLERHPRAQHRPLRDHERAPGRPEGLEGPAGRGHGGHGRPQGGLRAGSGPTADRDRPPSLPAAPRRTPAGTDDPPRLAWGPAGPRPAQGQAGGHGVQRGELGEEQDFDRGIGNQNGCNQNTERTKRSLTTGLSRRFQTEISPRDRQRREVVVVRGRRPVGRRGGQPEAGTGRSGRRAPATGPPSGSAGKAAGRIGIGARDRPRGRA